MASIEAAGYLGEKGDTRMREDVNELYERLVNAAAEGRSPQPLPAPNALPTVPFTELKENHSGTPFATSWNVYVREVGRLLAEGHEGKWVLIADAVIVGLFQTRREASMLAYSTYRDRSPMIHRVGGSEPVYRLSTRMIRCHTSNSPST